MTTPAANSTTDSWASVQNDKYYDRIPLASTLTNAGDLIEKAKMAWNRAYPPKEAATLPAKPNLDQQHYYRYLQEKSVFRCVVAMVPVLGNLCIWLYNQWSQDYGDFDKMVDRIQRQKTNSGVVETFKKASLELRCDQDFINFVEGQLIANLDRANSDDTVINFTDLLTYAGDEVVFSPKMRQNSTGNIMNPANFAEAAKIIMNRDNFVAAVKHNKDFLKHEAVGEQYERSGKIYADFCKALCEEHPSELSKVDPKMQEYLAFAVSCFTEDPEAWVAFAEKHVFDLRDPDGPDAQFFLSIKKILTEKMKTGGFEVLAPWVEGMVILRVKTSKWAEVTFMYNEELMRASAKEWPFLVDYRLYACANDLRISSKNWAQDPAFMSSLVNSASDDVNEYYLARYCDFDVRELPEGQIRENLMAALQKLKQQNLLFENELSDLLREKLEKGEDITPWVEGLFLLKQGISSSDFLMRDEWFIRDNAKKLPVLLDYRIYECAGALKLRFIKNWPQDPAFMSSLVNSASDDVKEYYLARYCDFDVRELPEGQIRENLIAALQKLKQQNLLPENKLSPRLITSI